MTKQHRIIPFKELSLEEFHDIVALRIKVFVIEQDCPYQELDGWDKHAEHLLTTMDGKLAATLRILPPDTVYEEHSIGRVVVEPAYRGTGLGHEIMQLAIDHLAEAKTLEELPIKLSAQEHLREYYQSHGFEQCGEGYLEDGIPHIPMIRILS